MYRNVEIVERIYIFFVNDLLIFKCNDDILYNFEIVRKAYCFIGFVIHTLSCMLLYMIKNYMKSLTFKKQKSYEIFSLPSPTQKCQEN